MLTWRVDLANAYLEGLFDKGLLGGPVRQMITRRAHLTNAFLEGVSGALLVFQLIPQDFVLWITHT